MKPTVCHSGRPYSTAPHTYKHIRNPRLLSLNRRSVSSHLQTAGRPEPCGVPADVFRHKAKITGPNIDPSQKRREPPSIRICVTTGHCEAPFRCLHVLRRDPSCHLLLQRGGPYMDRSPISHACQIHQQVPKTSNLSETL